MVHPEALEGRLRALKFWSEARRFGETGGVSSQCDNVRPPDFAGSAPDFQAWKKISQFTGLHLSFVKSQQMRYEELLQRSSALFSPLQDPLSCSFGLHRWLAGSREEAYSDWFAWVLERCRTWGVISKVLGSALHSPTLEISIEREVCIKYENCTSKGRLDVLISSGSRQLCVIEIKSAPYLQDDLEKQGLYSASAGVSPEADRIFIGIEENESCNFYGFRFVSWADICVRLRQFVPELLIREGHVIAALILAFIGAVEQNLLNLTSLPIENRASLTESAGYLERFLVEMERT